MTTEIRKIRPATPEDYEEILKLNEESVHFLSPLSKEKLIHLHQESEILKVVETDGKVEAFVLALREGKDYDSVNYAWFSKNYEKFCISTGWSYLSNNKGPAWVKCFMRMFSSMPNQ